MAVTYHSQTQTKGGEGEMKTDRRNSKSDLRRCALEAIRAAKCLVELRKNDLLRVGTYKTVRQRLDQLEKRLHRLKRKSFPSTIVAVAEEVGELIGESLKSLVRYLFPPAMIRLCPFYGSKDMRQEQHGQEQHRINTAASEGCLEP